MSTKAMEDAEKVIARYDRNEPIASEAVRVVREYSAINALRNLLADAREKEAALTAGRAEAKNALRVGDRVRAIGSAYTARYGLGTVTSIDTFDGTPRVTFDGEEGFEFWIGNESWAVEKVEGES